MQQTANAPVTIRTVPDAAPRSKPSGTTIYLTWTVALAVCVAVWAFIVYFALGIVI